jgi:hypothetical protein
MTASLGLRAVTRQLLVKALQVGEDLVCALVICKVWKLPMALELSVTTSRVLKWSINPISNPKHLRVTHTRDNIKDINNKGNIEILEIKTIPL